MRVASEKVAGRERSFFVCPVCRFIFGVEGVSKAAVVCPGCKHMVAVEGLQGGLRSAQELMLDFDNNSKCEWERDESPPLKDNAWVTLTLWLILSACVLGMGYVSAIILTVKEGEVASVSESKADYVLLGKEHIEKFFDAETVEEIWELVDQEESALEDVEAYVNKYELFTQQMALMGAGFKLEGRDFPRALYEVNIGNSRLSVLVSFEHGLPLIEWGTISGSNNTDIKSLEAGQSEVFRSFVMEGKNYDFEFTEEDWFCVKVNMVGDDLPYYAYVNRKDVKILQDLRNLFDLENGEKMILKIKKMEGKFLSARYQVLEVVSSDWVYP